MNSAKRRHRHLGITDLNRATLVSGRLLGDFAVKNRVQKIDSKQTECQPVGKAG